MARFFCASLPGSGSVLDLPDGAARHVQVLRLQPGDVITLFSGLADAQGQFGEHTATITQMGRHSVQVQIGQWTPTQRETVPQIHLAIGMPANERMDWLVEKATELGVTSLWPLMTERSVLRLSGERASKKQTHWQSIALAACEQCGGNRIPTVHEPMTLVQWLKTRPLSTPAAQLRSLLLSLRAPSMSLHAAVALPQASHGPSALADDLVFLCGPEGGLNPAEEDAALGCGFTPVTLGPRVLRSETAALAALAALRFF